MRERTMARVETVEERPTEPRWTAAKGGVRLLFLAET